MDDTIKIVGSTTVTPMTVPDLAQTDEKKADYVKNKRVSLLANDMGYIDDITFYSALAKVVKYEDYVLTDNNFTDELKAKLESCHIFSGYYEGLIGDIGVILGGNGLDVASQTFVKNYVAEQLGVIENGAY